MIQSNCIIWWQTKKTWPHRINCVTHTILDIRPEFFFSAAILCSLKPSLPNNIVSLKFSQSFNFVLFFLWRYLMRPQFFLDPSTKNSILFWCFFLFFFRNSNKTWQKTAFYKKNHLFKKSSLTTNIFMLVNLEPIFGFILEINRIPNHLHGHMVVSMCFNMGHLVKNLAKNEAKLEVPNRVCPPPHFLCHISPTIWEKSAQKLLLFFPVGFP